MSPFFELHRQTKPCIEGNDAFNFNLALHTNLQSKTMNIKTYLSKFYNHSILNKAITFIIALFVLVQVSIFIFRGPIANHLIQNKASHFNTKHNAELHIGQIKFHGLAGVEIQDIFLKENHKDTLLKIQSTYARVNFFKLLIFKVSLIDFKLENTYLHLVRKNNSDNYSGLISSEEKNEDTIKTTTNRSFEDQANSLLAAMFDLLPSDILIKNLHISADLGSYQLAMQLDEFKVIDHNFKTQIQINESGSHQKWRIEGTLNPSENHISGKWFSNDTNKVRIPYLLYKFKTKLAFDTMYYSFSQEKGPNSAISVRGDAEINGLVVDNRRISTEEVLLNRGKFHYMLHVNDNTIELDSNSVVEFNQLVFNPYLRYSKLPEPIFEFSIHKPWFEAQQLFSSLPKGLFDNLEGMKVKGQLKYSLILQINFNHLDSLRFESEMKQKDFSIVNYGKTDLRKMNGSFEYTAYEKGEAVRSFMVGTENPNFRSMQQIPKHLVDVILYSEDLGFFYHNGFSESALQAAWVTNIKAKRFKRGASTISMQLVKNVFLNRNKTLTRKVEEALIVWLIESRRLSSKQRMMEVYLNIIEWGPMVYGANEAAQFYFSKDVAQINLAEAIFMASIIPKPKWYRGSFDNQGHLNPSLTHYYSNISQRMLKNNAISQQDFDQLKPEVELKGEALRKILESNIVADSIAPIVD